MAAARWKLVSAVGFALRSARKLDVPCEVCSSLQTALYALLQKASVERPGRAMDSSFNTGNPVVISLHDALWASGALQCEEGSGCEEKLETALHAEHFLEEPVASMSCAQSGTDGPFDVKIDGDKMDVDEVCPLSDDRQEDEGDQSNHTLVELPDSPRSYLQHFLQQAASNSEVIEGLQFLKAQLKDTIHSATSSSVSHRAWTGRLYQEICEQLRQIQSTKGYTTEAATDSINQIQSGLSRVHSHPSIEAKHTPHLRNGGVSPLRVRIVPKLSSWIP